MCLPERPVVGISRNSVGRCAGEDYGCGAGCAEGVIDSPSLRRPRARDRWPASGGAGHFGNYLKLNDNALHVHDRRPILAAMAINKIPPSPEWRRALEILDHAGQNGSAEAVLIANGFSDEMLVSIARAGLATATTDKIKAGSRTIEIAWMRITNAGRFALNNN
jgi:hypothetical protein